MAAQTIDVVEMFKQAALEVDNRKLPNLKPESVIATLAPWRIAYPVQPPMKISGMVARLIISPFVACLVPCRAATCAISCAMTPASSATPREAATQSPCI